MLFSLFEARKKYEIQLEVSLFLFADPSTCKVYQIITKLVYDRDLIRVIRWWFMEIFLITFCLGR